MEAWKAFVRALVGNLTAVFVTPLHPLQRGKEVSIFFVWCGVWCGVWCVRAVMLERISVLCRICVILCSMISGIKKGSKCVGVGVIVAFRRCLREFPSGQRCNKKNEKSSFGFFHFVLCFVCVLCVFSLVCVCFVCVLWCFGFCKGSYSV